MHLRTIGSSLFGMGTYTEMGRAIRYMKLMSSIVAFGSDTPHTCIARVYLVRSLAITKGCTISKMHHALSGSSNGIPSNNLVLCLEKLRAAVEDVQHALEGR